mgnify:CR=1 FL=1
MPVKTPDRITTDSDSTPMVRTWWMIKRIRTGGRNAQAKAETKTETKTKTKTETKTESKAETKSEAKTSE